MMSDGFSVLGRFWRNLRGEIEEVSMGTEARDFDTENRDRTEIGDGDPRENRRRGRSWTCAPVVTKAVGLMSRCF